MLNSCAYTHTHINERSRNGKDHHLKSPRGKEKITIEPDGEKHKHVEFSVLAERGLRVNFAIQSGRKGENWSEGHSILGSVLEDDFERSGDGSAISPQNMMNHCFLLLWQFVDVLFPTQIEEPRTDPFDVIPRTRVSEILQKRLLPSDLESLFDGQNESLLSAEQVS